MADVGICSPETFEMWQSLKKNPLPSSFGINMAVMQGRTKGFNQEKNSAYAELGNQLVITANAGIGKEDVLALVERFYGGIG